MNSVLAIIVTYNAMPWLDRCLGSLKKSSGVRIDIFVVDNGSTDGTQAFIRKNYPQVMLRESCENLGFGAANNLGLRYALDKKYDYVYLLNQDAWVEKDTIRTLIGVWPEGFGILSPVQKDAKGRLDRNFKKKCGRYLGGLNEVETVPFVMAAHWLMSRDTIRKVGGFSPAFKQYGEDDNYIHRLHWHGLKVGVVTSASAVHDRAGRKDSKERRMRLKCISTVVKLSDPNHCGLGRAIREPFELMGMSLKNVSLVPLKFIPELTSSYKELFKLRRMSKKKTAFL